MVRRRNFRIVQEYQLGAELLYIPEELYINHYYTKQHLNKNLQVIPFYIVADLTVDSLIDSVQFADQLISQANSYFPKDYIFKLQEVNVVPELNLSALQAFRRPYAITVAFVNSDKNHKVTGFADPGNPNNQFSGLIFMYINVRYPFQKYLQTFVHELGHLYGLQHKSRKEDVMYPDQVSIDAIPYTREELSEICGNKWLYGKAIM